MTTITIDRATVEQALEALEKYRKMMFVEAGCRFGEGDAAITNLRAALAQQAEPAQKQDAELSAALGWPGGISNPVLDRKVLLQKVAALRLASQQALEAMETVELDIEWRAASPTHKMLSKAITALRAALAQQADPTDPGRDVDVLREHVRHLEQRVRELHAQKPEPAPTWKPAEWKRGCAVCGIGADGKAYGYVCPRLNCPTKVTSGGAV